MGLIKVFKDTVGGVLEDQWREFFSCDSLPNDVLVRRGRKATGKRSSNKGDDNVISNGSIVTVAPGQFMLISDQGRIVDFSDEPGEYLYDQSTEASLFFNDEGLGTSIKESFKNAVKRFTFAGHPGKDQRIYYFNTKPILSNRYGTPNPVPFRIVDENIGLNMVMPIRAHGEYSYKIVNPLLFYVNVSGNVEEDYTTDLLDAQLRSELMTALQPAFAKISALGISYDELPLHTIELADALNEVLSAKWTELRGLAIDSLGISSVTASEEDVKRLQDMQSSAIYRDARMAAAGITAAQADAMRKAAENEGAGAFMAFAGMGAAAGTGGMNAGQLFEQAAREEQAKAAQAAVVAPAEPLPVSPSTPGSWTCGTCGHGQNQGKFCEECGRPKPPSAQYRCDKCGFVPSDQANPPKFCPECGDVFNEQDRVNL
jgi:membrane protease subunit (stomatin/prohibitin family)